MVIEGTMHGFDERMKKMVVVRPFPRGRSGNAQGTNSKVCEGWDAFLGHDDDRGSAAEFQALAEGRKAKGLLTGFDVVHEEANSFPARKWFCQARIRRSWSTRD